MAKYDFKCTDEDCGNVQEEVMKMSEKDGAQISCNECGSPSEYTFTPTMVYMHLRGDGWPSKTLREANYRKKRYAVMSQRQRDHVQKPELHPNFNGQDTGTWADAQTAAHDAGKNHHSYDKLVNKEQAGKSTKGKIVTATG